MASVFRTRLRILFPLHVRFRHPERQLHDAAFPFALRRRLFLGGVCHSLAGVQRPPAPRSPKPPRIRNGPLMTETVTPQMVREAAARIVPLAPRTAVMTSRSIDARAGLATFFKCENLQRGGAFKIRGAANLVLSIP